MNLTWAGVWHQGEGAGGEIGFLQPFAVYVHAAVLDADGIGGPGHDALDGQIGVTRVVNDDNFARHGITINKAQAIENVTLPIMQGREHASARDLDGSDAEVTD